MKMFVTLTLFALLTGCAHQDEWTKSDTAMELLFQAGVVIDSVQTGKIHERPGMAEGGPIARRFIGTQPSQADAYLYGASRIVSHYFIARALPKEWRAWYQVYTTIYQVDTVLDNYDTYDEWKARTAEGEWVGCSYPEC